MIVSTFNVAAKAKAWQRATWSHRLPAIRESVAYYRPDVLCVQEAGSSSYVRRLDIEMAKVGLVRAPGGGRWRYIYYNPNRVHRYASGLFSLNRWHTKHAAWAKFRDIKTGTKVFVTSAHLSEGGEAKAQTRYNEAQRLLDLTLTVNKGQYPEIHAGDYNSERLVGAVVMEPHHFYDAREVATNKHHAQYDTFNGRTGVTVPASIPAKGRHLDHIYVDVDLDADVYYWSQRPFPEASDHNIVTMKVSL